MHTPDIEQTVAALTANHFSVYRAADPDVARTIIVNDILPELDVKTVSFGDSLTLLATGVLDHFRADPAYAFIDTFEEGVDRPEIMRRRKQALTADLFLTGSNAVTAAGKLVNLDMVGNRVGGIVFGPEHVIITVGTNKLVPDANAAVQRIRTVAAPQNAARHHARTPCAKTGRCMDCNSPDRICNVWTITEKSWPQGRIRIILIDQPLGL